MKQRNKKQKKKNSHKAIKKNGHRSHKSKIKKVTHRKINKTHITKKKTEKKGIALSKIQRIINSEHPDDLYITIKLIGESETSKLLIYFRKNHSKIKKNKELSKIIMVSKNKSELLNNLKMHLSALLKKEHDELKQRISKIRKSGVDMFIEDLRLMKVPSKIRLFEATEDKHDFYTVKSMLEIVKKEVNMKSKQ